MLLSSLVFIIFSQTIIPRGNTTYYYYSITLQESFTSFSNKYTEPINTVCVLVLSWEGFSGVRVLALPGDVSYAANHGVYLSDQQVLILFTLMSSCPHLYFIDSLSLWQKWCSSEWDWRSVCFVSQGQIRDIIYKGTKEQIQQAAMPDGKVPLVRPPLSPV